MISNLSQRKYSFFFDRIKRNILEDKDSLESRYIINQNFAYLPCECHTYDWKTRSTYHLCEEGILMFFLLLLFFYSSKWALREG